MYEPRYRQDHRPSGFMLLEVAVALAVLSVGLLAVAHVFGAASSRAAAALARRAALTAAGEIAGAAAPTADYPSGWRELGGAGADGLVGTDDDPPDPGRLGPPCWVRTSRSTTAELTWLWVEAECGAAARPGEIGPVESVVSHGPRGSMTTVQRVRLVACLGSR